jgi:hypothetical protein
MYITVDATTSRVTGIASNNAGMPDAIEIQVNDGDEVLVNPFVFTYINGVLAKDDDYQLSVVRKQQIGILNTACQNSIFGDFTSTLTDTNGIAYTFGFNSHDQMNFNSQLNMINNWKLQVTEGTMTSAQYATKFPISWKASNTGVITLTEAQFYQVLSDAQAHLDKYQQQYWTLESKINAVTITTTIADAIAEIQAIVWIP